MGSQAFWGFRISISCLLPASWHFSLSPSGCPLLNASLRQLLLLGAATATLLLCSVLLLRAKYGRGARDRSVRYGTGTSTGMGQGQECQVWERNLNRYGTGVWDRSVRYGIGK
uniref:Uncharacterized protein n=1 Tax=Malurus cyaneus samueli TaxID=2593467 RepID=A0A8C5TR70_9PASS